MSEEDLSLLAPDGEVAQNAPRRVSGIYQIRNLHTQRIYIGKSSDIYGRWLAQRSALNRCLHINDDLQGDWEVYGAKAFEFTILEEVVGVDALQNAEARYLVATSNPYNVAWVSFVTEGRRRLVPEQSITPQQFLELLYTNPQPEWITALSEVVESAVGRLMYRLLYGKDNFTFDDFLEFQDWGCKGLYAGEAARDISARKGLKEDQPILDWMGPEELAANLFRATQTEAKLRRESTQTKSEANRTHYEAGLVVRRAIAELGGTMPEDLPTPSTSIQEVQRREQKRLEAQRQPSPFPPDEGEQYDTSE